MRIAYWVFDTLSQQDTLYLGWMFLFLNMPKQLGMSLSMHAKTPSCVCKFVFVSHFLQLDSHNLLFATNKFCLSHHQDQLVYIHLQIDQV